MTENELKEALQKEKKEREHLVMTEVQKILAENHCVFDFALTITQSGQVIPHLKVVANE